MGYILKIENLKYKDVLKDISFSLKENSFNVLVGENGSGKTTLVKAIVNLIKYEGTITLLGTEINNENVRDLIKNIGVLTEDNFLLNETSLYNITYPLLNLDYEETEAKKKAYEISKKLDIDNLLIKRAEELSLSEKKLVLFAKTIIHNPKLIIIDDTFEELDNYYRNKILNYLKAQKDKTILFITNNEEDILIADNLLIMKDGQVTESNSVKKLVNNKKVFIENNIKMPFLVNLSHKLIQNKKLKKIILDEEKLVEVIWK